MLEKKPLPEPLLYHSNSSGSILVITMWVVLILVIFVIGLTSLVSSQIHSFKHFRDSARAYLITKGAVNKAIVQLNKESKASWYDCLKEPWSNNAEAFKEIIIDGGSASVQYDYTYYETADTDPKHITFYGMLDEERRINLNTAKRGILTNLFVKVAELEPELAGQIAACIIDWRDPDSNPILGGAEDDYYLTIDPPYNCKDAPFQVKEELLLVKGITPEIFCKIEAFVTVFGAGRVNINTASFYVLISLGLTESLALKILRFRAGSDDIEGTEDDGIIPRTGELVSRIGKSYPLGEDEISLLNNLIIADLITVESKYYGIHARGTVNDKTAEIFCILERGGLIVFWQEH